MIAPLRKVIDKVYKSEYLIHELLECGHTQPVKQDIYGPTNAYRRRCWQCILPQPASTDG